MWGTVCAVAALWLGNGLAACLFMRAANGPPKSLWAYANVLALTPFVPFIFLLAFLGVLRD